MALQTPPPPPTPAISPTTPSLPILFTDLALTKVAPFSNSVLVPFTYNITVTNNGPIPATGVTVTDILPTGVGLFGPPPPGCTVSGGVVTCTIGNLAPGAMQSIVLLVRGNQTGTFTNTATVAGDQFDPIPANNTAMATTNLF